MSWLENYRIKNERERTWRVSADGETVYRGDGCRFKRTILPSIAQRSANAEVEELEESDGFSEIANNAQDTDD